MRRHKMLFCHRLKKEDPNQKTAINNKIVQVAKDIY